MGEMCQQSVADSDLQIRGVGGGGHPDPEIRGGGGLQKNFFRASFWSKNKYNAELSDQSATRRHPKSFICFQNNICSYQHYNLELIFIAFKS